MQEKLGEDRVRGAGLRIRDSALIARALAASCSRAGAEVSFFMRKGADVLSKWVGEAEKQLVQCLETREKILGSRTPEGATTLMNVAHLRQAQGRHKEAIGLLERALRTST